MSAARVLAAFLLFLLIWDVQGQCANLILLSNSMITDYPQYEVVAVTVQVTNGVSRFQCPTKTEFMYYSGSRLHKEPWYMVCDSSTNGWRVRSMANSQDTAYGNVPVGCVNTATQCSSLLVLSQSMLGGSYPKYEVTPDTTKGSNGVYRLQCPSGTEFAYVSGGSMTVIAPWYMVCDASTKGEWRVRSTANSHDSSYGNVPVGCVKVTQCPSLIVLTAPMIIAYPKYEVTSETSKITNGVARLQCPSGTEFAYVSGSSMTIMAPWYMICDGTTNGWRVRSTAVNSHDSYYGNVPVGCVKPASQCPSIQVLTQSMISAFPKYEEVTSDTVTTSNGVSRLECPLGTAFAYVAGGALNIVAHWYMICDGTTNGWRVRSTETGHNDTYGQVPVGCVKRCAPLTYITNSMLSAYKYENPGRMASESLGKMVMRCYAPLEFAYMEGSKLVVQEKWHMSCDANDGKGWRVKSLDSGTMNDEYMKVPVGCLLDVSCPALPYITDSMLSSYSKHEASTYTSTTANKVSQLRCPGGTEFAVMSGGEMTIKPWYMYCDGTTNGWRMRSTVDAAYNEAIGNNSVGCVKQRECGCPLSSLSAEAFVNWSGDKSCNVQCAKGYRFSNDLTSVTCTNSVWDAALIGSYRVLEKAPSISCVPVSGTCGAGSYQVLPCLQCSPDQLFTFPRPSGHCAIACDRGYRLLMSRTGDFPVMRVQETNLGSGKWTLRPLGAIKSSAYSPSPDTWFNCEPVPGEPNPSPPACGCDFEFLMDGVCLDVGVCDHTQLTARHDGAGSCMVGCNPGFQLVSDVRGVITAAVCFNYAWTGRDGLTSTLFQTIRPQYNCKKAAAAPGACSAPYTLLSAAGCTTSDCPKMLLSSALRPLTTSLQCQLGCENGFRLVAAQQNNASGALRYAEITMADAKWSGLTATGAIQTLTSLFVNCEKEPESPVIPLGRCGCGYSTKECSGCDASKLQYRSVWPENNNCELICAPGYTLVHSSDMSLVVCQNGKWTGRDYSNKNIVSMPASPQVTCRKIEKYGCEGVFMPLSCTNCNQAMLLPIPSGMDCQLTCRAGWRIVIKGNSGTENRPRVVYQRGTEWFGTSGVGLLTTSYYGSQPSVSCEPDSYPPLPDPVPAPKPPVKPCEECRGLSLTDACPSGKECHTEFYKMFRTAEGCMQARCAKERTMMIYKDTAFTSQSTKALNCGIDGSWTMNGTSTNLGSNVLFTCDLKSNGSMSIEEIFLEIARSGKNLMIWDKDFVSSFAGW